ncbi:MAG: M23 family metallopeptidase [Elusimicrobiota bacterium]
MQINTLGFFPRINLYFAVFLSLAVVFSACGRHTQQKNLQGKIKQGDILDKILTNSGLTPQSSSELIKTLTSATDFNARNCKIDDTFELAITTFGTWISFRYNTQGFDYYTVERTREGKILAEKMQVESKKILQADTGVIQSTLWDAMISKKISGETIMNFTEVFQWEIDFLTEPRAGDIFKIIREQIVSKSGKILKEEILAGRYTASGHMYDAVLFTDPEGNKSFYTPKGEALKKAFLKAPLSYRRISSYFSKRRFHPVLKYVRPHLGIDYAAQSGTPVDSIGDGTVVSSGWKGGFGRQVIIRHANGYVTYYGHLSRISPGIRSGARVTQGRQIGNVGSSGLSTGPHLDFRISQNGVFKNFLDIKIPPAKNVPNKYKKLFHQQTKDLLTKLAKIR